MYEPLTDIPPRIRQIHRWIWLATDIPIPITRHYRWLQRLAPEDYSQSLALAVLCYGNDKSCSLESCVQREMRALARALGYWWFERAGRWERQQTVPEGIAAVYEVPQEIVLRGLAAREDRRKNRTGYRTDPDRHRAARNKVSPERRAEIARMGAAARKERKEKI